MSLASPARLIACSPRAAVSAVFLTNGAVFASLVARIPELKADLHLSSGRLGLVLLGVGLGGLVGSTSSRWVVPRVGVRTTVTASAVVLAVLLPAVAVAPTALALFAVLIALGVADGLTDVAMNSSGLEVQRERGRSVLVSMHALWSVGAVLGSLGGTAAIATGVPMTVQLVVVSLLITVVTAAAAPMMPAATPPGQDRPGRATPALVVLCVLAVFAAFVEDAPANWSAIYLVEGLGADDGAAGLAYALFMTAMVMGRLGGDALIDRLGSVTVVRSGAVLGFVALLVAVISQDPVVAIIAFGLMGAGSAALFPALFAAAGARGPQAISLMNATARLGFLIAPVGVGHVADHLGIAGGLALLTLPALAGIALLAGVVGRTGQPAAAQGRAHRRRLLVPPGGRAEAGVSWASQGRTPDEVRALLAP